MAWQDAVKSNDPLALTGIRHFGFRGDFVDAKPYERTWEPVGTKLEDAFAPTAEKSNSSPQSHKSGRTPEWDGEKARLEKGISESQRIDERYFFDAIEAGVGAFPVVGPSLALCL